jgi:hypothetical protein
MTLDSSLSKRLAMNAVKTQRQTPLTSYQIKIQTTFETVSLLTNFLYLPGRSPTFFEQAFS